MNRLSMKGTKSKILLVNPGVDSEVEAFRDFFTPMLSFWDKRAYMTPLPLATLAALTPDEFEVDIWDEPVHGYVDETMDWEEYGLVGVTGFIAHISGAKRVGRFFKERGIPVVAGGAGVSASPELYRDDFDALFIGESEYLWPQFLSDWQKGVFRNTYQQIHRPSMDEIPLPCWDSIAGDMQYYLTGGVQTARGCPFDCEFCQVAYLNGRRVRLKPIEQVIEEICVLERLGVKSIMFCDDNFVANHRYTKDLLRELIPVNNAFEVPLSYHTELSLDLAKDDELLQLMQDVNFGSVCIGLETPNKESLKETNKPQNYKTDIVEAVHKILSYGLGVRAGLIVGFDSDDQSIFDRQFEFIQETCIHGPVINMIKACTGTRLWSRLHKDRRLIDEEHLILTNEAEDCKYTAEYLFAHTNIIPKQMTRVELMTGFKSLLERVHDWESFAQRVRGFITLSKQRVNADTQTKAIAVTEAQRRDILQRVFKATQGMDEKGRFTILSLLSYTRTEAPFLLGTVLRFILYHLGTARVSREVRASLDKQIEREKAIPDLEPYVDKRPVLVPEAFERVYDETFPEIYQRAREGLTDPALVPTVLTEVYTDFLIHGGDDPAGLANPYLTVLYEIADRMVAVKNRTGRQGMVVLDGTALDSNEVRRQLRFEVLCFVERNMREFRYSGVNEELLLSG